MKRNLSITATVLAIAAGGISVQAFAEATISVYGGANFSPHSVVKTNGPTPSTRNTVGWDGVSFSSPPYWGLRGAWWLEEVQNVGIAIDYTHSKVKASPLPPGFNKLEFTDGINFLTANALYRKDMGNGFTPYGGIGLGLSVPHVEAGGPAVGGFKTIEYQVTGLAAQALVGIDYAINDKWSLFGELKSTYGQVNADLNGGYKLKTNIVSNQIIFGVTYKLY